MTKDPNQKISQANDPIRSRIAEASSTESQGIHRNFRKAWRRFEMMIGTDPDNTGRSRVSKDRNIESPRRPRE